MSFQLNFLRWAIVSAVAGLGGHVFAVPTLRITSGSSTFTVEDGGIGDLNPESGWIRFVGSIDSFSLITLHATTKPLYGSTAFPQMGLEFYARSDGAGAVSVSFSETGFTGSGSFKNSFYVSAEPAPHVLPPAAVLGYVASGGSSNVLFDETNVLTQLEPTSVNFIGSLGSSDFSGPVAAGNYSLTLTFTLAQGPGSRDASGRMRSRLEQKQGENVPDKGSAALLMVVALLPLVGLRRLLRRR